VKKLWQKAKSPNHKVEEALAFDKSNIPTHIAVIMDGNGRWAKKRNLPRTAGHYQGMTAVENIVEACDDLGVKILTVFAFSTENWQRPQAEVSLLMKLLKDFAAQKLTKLKNKNVQVKILGDLNLLPKEARMAVEKAVKDTKENTGLIFNIALNYGGRWDIVEAAKKIAEEVEQGKLKACNINEECFAKRLSTSSLPDPDLLIRTSGEQRLSNFLLWQLAYSEFYYTDIYWPDFDKNELIAAISHYQKRQRRFGKV
jgi:undecaprenyl diphosphate synthase